MLVANPDAVPEPDAVGTLARFHAGAPSRGDRGPTDPLAGRGMAAVPPPLSDCARHARATDAAPCCCAGRTAQREHYHLDERPTEPAQADWLLGAFLLMRRAMLDELGGWDGGFRHYGEDIDLVYRAVTRRVGAVVRAGRARHARLRGGRSTACSSPGTRWWHLRGMARFVRKHPERLLRLVEAHDFVVESVTIP